MYSPAQESVLLYKKLIHFIFFNIILFSSEASIGFVDKRRKRIKERNQPGKATACIHIGAADRLDTFENAESIISQKLY